MRMAKAVQRLTPVLKNLQGETSGGKELYVNGRGS